LTSIGQDFYREVEVIDRGIVDRLEGGIVSVLVTETPAVRPEPDRRPRRQRRWLHRVALSAVLLLFTVELIMGWPSLTTALVQLRVPRPGWFIAAVVAEMAAMAAYARMQRRLLLSTGLFVPLHRHVALAYAAHSLSVTLPGGPAFSTRFNYQQMRRFGATPAVASWCIAMSGILSGAALAVVTAASAFAAHGVPQWHTVAGFVVATTVIILGIRQITRRPEAMEPATRAALAYVNRIRHRPATQGLDRIHGFVEQLRVARLSPGHGAASAAYALLNWLLDAACLLLCFHAVSDAPIGPTQVLLAFCAGMAAGTLTVIPGGLGIIDSAMILGLVAGGVATATAIAAVVLYRLISFGFIIGAGWITWLAIRQRRDEASGARRTA
jgi:uncharacterized membrane protein YbhN (UPF0104 family)